MKYAAKHIHFVEGPFVPAKGVFDAGACT